MDLLKLVYWFVQLLGRIYDNVGAAKDAVIAYMKEVFEKIDLQFKEVFTKIEASQTATADAIEKKGSAVVQAVNDTISKSDEVRAEAFRVLNEKLNSNQLGIKEDEVRKIFETALPEPLLREFKWESPIERA